MSKKTFRGGYSPTEAEALRKLEAEKRKPKRRVLVWRADEPKTFSEWIRDYLQEVEK